MHSIDDVVKQSIPLQGAGKIVSPLPPSYSIRTGFSHTFSPLIYTIYTEIAKNETNFICQVPVGLHSPSYHIAKCMHAEWQGYGSHCPAISKTSQPRSNCSKYEQWQEYIQHTFLNTLFQSEQTLQHTAATLLLLQPTAKLHQTLSM